MIDFKCQTQLSMFMEHARSKVINKVRIAHELICFWWLMLCTGLQPRRGKPHGFERLKANLCTS